MDFNKTITIKNLHGGGQYYNDSNDRIQYDNTEVTDYSLFLRFSPSKIGTDRRKCVTNKMLQQLNSTNITVDNYTGYTDYNTFSTEEILNTTIVEKKYRGITDVSTITTNLNEVCNTYLDSSCYTINLPALFSNYPIEKCLSYIGGKQISISGNISCIIQAKLPSNYITSAAQFTGKLHIYLVNGHVNSIFRDNRTLLHSYNITINASKNSFITNQFNNVSFVADLATNTSIYDAFCFLHGSTTTYNFSYTPGLLLTAVIELDSGMAQFTIDSKLEINYRTFGIYAPEKVSTFKEIRNTKVLLPMRVGLHSRVGSLNVSYMKLLAKYRSSGSTSGPMDASSFTEYYLNTKTGMSNTNNGEYKKWLTYIPLFYTDYNPFDTLDTTDPDFALPLDSASHLVVQAGETTAKRNWTVEIFDNTNILSDFSDDDTINAKRMVINAADNKTINRPILIDAYNNNTDSATTRRPLNTIFRDTWGMLLTVKT